jgi:hypothetical protein
MADETRVDRVLGYAVERLTREQVLWAANAPGARAIAEYVVVHHPERMSAAALGEQVATHLDLVYRMARGAWHRDECGAPEQLVDHLAEASDRVLALLRGEYTGGPSPALRDAYVELRVSEALARRDPGARQWVERARAEVLRLEAEEVRA